MIDIVIKDFPMPISVNKSLIPVIGKIKFTKHGKPKGVGRLVKTEDYRKFESKCMDWELAHKTGLEKLKEEIILRKRELEAIGKPLTLKVDFYAVFPESKIIDGLKLERLDSDNRIKPAKDLLFRSLNLDDKHVFADHIEKVVGSSEYMIIRISECLPRTEQQVKSLFGIKS